MTSSEAALDGCRPWALPELDGAGPVTVGDIESVHREAYAQGLEEGRREGDRRGFEEGRARAEAELRPRVAEFAELARSLADPLDRVDDEVEHSLVALATAVARQIVLRELGLAPERVVEVVREAIRALPLNARGVRVALHPHDGALVREALAADAEEGNLRIVDDAALTRGGCRVQTETSSIDATVEARLSTVIWQVMGGEPADPSAAHGGADAGVDE